ncbi:putative lipid phosphate phosphatase 3, chloroplastic [Vitis vinifera]|uniref:Putative lipid phosphate phosphatase 3, chloroplastic n=1 Tax=Vitis vinifera TaxID=29760 RepID=A0A438C226_VITVI|nr:putative lipid phosphate phosphatase 3, chloroplastic [Vitis vinifera]
MEHEGTIREVEPGCHTIKSHGLQVAKDHKHDWLILLLLVMIAIILLVIHPFYRFVGKDMMDDLKYPLKDNTVPVWAIPIYAVLLPIVIFILFYLRRRDVYDLHHSILGLFFSMLITAVITEAIKDAVGRPRPDFFWRCFPDGKDVYDQWGDVICHGKDSVIREGHKSFPSGHTSWSFAGLGFLSLYLSGKIQAFDRKGHVAKLCIVFLPLLAASLVGVSRVDDYWHHWQDVFAGGLLGLVVAFFCYLQFFPPPYDNNGKNLHFLIFSSSLDFCCPLIGPLCILQNVRGVEGQQTSSRFCECADAQGMEVVLPQQPSRNNNGFMPLSLDHDATDSLDQMEAGRRSQLLKPLSPTLLLPSNKDDEVHHLFDFSENKALRIPLPEVYEFFNPMSRAQIQLPLPETFQDPPADVGDAPIKSFIYKAIPSSTPLDPNCVTMKKVGIL